MYVRDCVTNKRSLGTNRICIRTHNAFEAYLAPMRFVSFFFFFLLSLSLSPPFFHAFPRKLKKKEVRFEEGRNEVLDEARERFENPKRRIDSMRDDSLSLSSLSLRVIGITLGNNSRGPSNYYRPVTRGGRLLDAR